MKQVVVLRPEPGASATIRRAHQHGFDAVSLPLFRIEEVAWQLPRLDSFDGLLLTSANAVRHGGPQLAQIVGWPVYAVGQETAAAADRAGFAVESIGSGGVDELLAALPGDLCLLHLCGEVRRQPSSPRQQVTAVAVYRAVTVDPPPPLHSLKGAVALVHSLRAGARLAELVPDRASTSLVAISSAAAEACGEGWLKVAVAEKPNDAALLSLAVRLCQESQPE